MCSFGHIFSGNGLNVVNSVVRFDSALLSSSFLIKKFVPIISRNLGSPEQIGYTKVEGFVIIVRLYSLYKIAESISYLVTLP